jgi:hypothetical protein
MLLTGERERERERERATTHADAATPPQHRYVMT